MVPISVLDLCPIVQGDSAQQALHKLLERARIVDKLSYNRLWVSEHHNMAGTASSATAVIIGRVADATTSIRVGSGGVMLPNHAPYVIAEQFGTLAAYHPGRIDLGLGRSPGTDAMTLRALRRDPQASARYPDDMQELLFFLGKGKPGQTVRAIPGAGADLSVWVLGSSMASAGLAARLGLAFAFASHVTPDNLFQAIDLYRSNFQPSAYFDAPYVMPCINVIAAETDAEARHQFTSTQLGLVNFFRGRPAGTVPPNDEIETIWSADEKRMIQHMHTHSIAGDANTVRQRLTAFVADTGADEVMVAGNLFRQSDHIRSLEIIAGAASAYGRTTPVPFAARS
jgi:luciferase family oxidoreductase group 1